MAVNVMALSKKERVMARSKFLRLLRSMSLSRGFGLATRFQCITCGDQVKLQRGDSVVLQTDGMNSGINPKTDTFSLACRCTHWSIR